MRIALTRFGYNTTDEQVNAVWITRILQTRVGYYAISATTVPQVQGWMTSQSFLSEHLFYYAIFYNATSHKAAPNAL